MEFHFPHVRIIGNHQCGKELNETFKHRGEFYKVMSSHDYTERVVSIFAHQIQSE